MKKRLWGLVGVALAASVVAASAQEVLSANTIGYIKKELPPGGKMISLTVPLFSMTEGSNVFGRTSFAQEAPNGSWVYFWDTTNQMWSPGNKSTKGIWTPSASNYVVKATEGFFFQTSNATSWVWTNAKPYTWP